MKDDEIELPTTDEKGYEHHPSFGTFTASRIQSTGTRLFDSDINHHEFVQIEISTAMRKRDLNSDWIHSDRNVVTIEMSLAQWGAAVSSFGQGGGVPVTIHRRDGLMVPEAPHDPRMGESLREVRDASANALGEIKTAFNELQDAIETGATKKVVGEKTFHLKCMIENLPANMVFAGEQLAKHTENVITKAQADIEGIVRRQAERLGLDPEIAMAEAAHALSSGDEPPAKKAKKKSKKAKRYAD